MRRAWLVPILALAGALPWLGAGGASDPAVKPDWKALERLVEEQKFQAAAEMAAGLRSAAGEAGDDEAWTRAFVREVQLRIGLHGYETAVRFLREEPWPEDPLSRMVLDLFYAEALLRYQRAYSWEIGTRERIAGDETVDLAAWTREQIVAEAHRAFAAAWERREAWGDRSLGTLAEFFEQNTWPARIRGTLRDAVSYLWVELLADTSLWSPAEEHERYRLDLERLVDDAGEPVDPASLEEAHPLQRLVAVLGDLEAWHAREDRPEAAFEARLERVRRLHDAWPREEDRRTIRAHLEQRLEAFGKRYEWWSVGQALLAELVRDQADDPQALAKARAIALEGEQAHPGSIGARRCRHLVASIEQPGFSLAAMASDGPRRRSIAIEHRNLPELHFRAYAFDLERAVAEGQDYRALPHGREVERLLGGKPVAEWTVALPSTPDFRSHRTYVVPPLDRPGAYAIVASARRDFAARHNRRGAVNLVLGDLVLLTRPLDGAFEVTALSGVTGGSVAGAEVSLYHFDFRGGHRRVERGRTGADGVAVLPASAGNGASYFVVGALGDQVAVDARFLSAPAPPPREERSAALVYTDRAIYRPGQAVLWKVVAYRAGAGDDPRFAIEAERELAVELVDANGETVETATVTTNRFGSASGSFTVPSGRLLGAWFLRTSNDGHATVQVEEYKRPTFEIEIVDPEDPLRLNRPAALAGRARYYFGLPVTGGEVSWRVTREPLYPLWRGGWWPPGAGQVQTVAAGTTSLDARGAFEVSFTPEADEREAAEGTTYRYRLDADVTDDGGETRSATRTFRLGFVAVEATLEPARRFFVEGEAVAVDARLADLDGRPLAGDARWELVALEQPAAPRMPAERPVELPVREGDAFRTEGDRLRPRWDVDHGVEEELRSWPDGRRVARGEAAHGEDGAATLELGRLSPGAYRLRYSTEDRFGARFETRGELLVVSPTGPTPLALPAVLLAETTEAAAGGTIRLLVHSGLAGQRLTLETFHDGRRVDVRTIESGGDSLLEVPVTGTLRGGVSFRLACLRDWQLLAPEVHVAVPWDDRRIEVEFETFRDRLRPGARETWRVRLRGADETTLAADAAEVLAYMFDRSLDLFASHTPPSPLSLLRDTRGTLPLSSTLGHEGESWREGRELGTLPEFPFLRPDRLKLLDGYGIGGPGRRSMPMALAKGTAEAVTFQDSYTADLPVAGAAFDSGGGAPPPAPAPAEPEPVELREDFSETAFFLPHLVADEDGSVAFEFEVPDSVTEWSVWVHALTRDLRGGSLERRTRTVKELMVRPYLPRFLREGDRAAIEVLVQNAGDAALDGTLDFEILDPETERSLLDEFGLRAGSTSGVPFRVDAGGQATLRFPLEAPSRVGTVAFRVTARAGSASDGELRPLPLLPGRLHLAQSRFAVLRDAERKVLRFDDLARSADPTRIDERLVVTLDGQLFYGLLHALPYLVDYPYECTEQTLNRFLSTGILSSLYDEHPAVARMAESLKGRDTRLETWDTVDPNRKIALEETPWIAAATGGGEPGTELLDVLDPRIAAAQRDAALAELREVQTASGGFPWWPGGPPSPFMTLYLLQGFSRAIEFGVDVPRDVVQNAWRYVHRHYVDEIVRDLERTDCCWETVTLLGSVLSSYPDDSWTAGVFDAADRRRMLDFSFRHWREHSPRLKAELALTLHRSGRDADARLVFASLMDSARTTEELGTFWAPEERAWLWYNDTVEGHALALRTMIELGPDDARRHGLVQWLLLNKQLNHWKSTRATAEAIYALVHYLEHEGPLAVREEVEVRIGPREERFVFEPDRYTGRANRVVVEDAAIDPATMSSIAIGKQTPGFLFASATWHFSTERLPEEARGDLFSVERTYFRRELRGEEWTLAPLAEGTALAAGDQVEVRLRIRARHAAEYVHLRDPRGAGFEPEAAISRYRWDAGLGRYEEVRDSGTSFFFEWLPAGEYTLSYRLRAATAGTFRVGPATLQSMYAPEFTAYSAGAVLRVGD